MNRLLINISLFKNKYLVDTVRNFVCKAVKFEGRILLSGSSQGESSVMRVRLEGRKKTIMNIYALAYNECTLAHYEYALGGSDVYSTSANVYSLPLMCICNGLVCIRNGFFMTLKSDSHY